MAYTPKTWNCGDSITIADMNRIENGVAQMSGGGGYLEPMIISFDHYETEGSYQVPYMDKTWQQVSDAFSEGRAVIFDYGSIPGSSDPIRLMLIGSVTPDYYATANSSNVRLYASTAADYLSLMLDY